MMGTTNLPMGPAPAPVDSPHFPDRLHTFVWRNWQLVPVERLARIVGVEPAAILRVGRAMGLAGPPPISADQLRRAAITIIRRNWHLLPYGQLLLLLGWTEEQMAYSLREDDFLFIKLGNLKPHCEPLTYRAPDERTLRRESDIAQLLGQEFADGVGHIGDPLFSFVGHLSQPDGATSTSDTPLFAPRFCYSYFALYGDPLLEEGAALYPDGYLSRLAASGVDGIWLQAVLYKLAPFPWAPHMSAGYTERLDNLRLLIARARRHGMGVYLYLNEPRAMPLAFYDAHPGLRGVVEGDYAALCTSAPAVQEYIRDAVAAVCQAVPDLAGMFTITASENLTNCWSHYPWHHEKTNCPRCSRRSGADVLAEANTLIYDGIRRSGSPVQCLVWDWGWPDEWVETIIDQLPTDISFMSVSEWDIPITRGGVASVVGEYALSVVGPGPRATRHWALARRRGMKTIAKVQASTTWELSAVPYIPAVENAAWHVANLRESHVDGLMLSWTLGGYPSPNVAAIAAIGRSSDVTVEEALEEVARRQFGPTVWPLVVTAWRGFSAAFGEFPFHIAVAY